jgi:hypothetical protein
MSAFGWITLGATVVLVISVAKSRSAENILDHDLAGGCYAVATIALTVMAISGALTVFI